MKEKLFISWVISAIAFALSSIPFFAGFFFIVAWEIMYFAICLVIMILFGAVYLNFDKQMRERKDCSKYEYIYFYKKCKKAGASEKCRLNDKTIIKQCAKELSYFANIEDDEVVEIYRKGFREYNKKSKGK